MDTRPIAARQPIFDAHQRVFGYELLFRSGFENCFTFPDGDVATSRVLDSFMLQGLETLWQHQRAFINFTGNALLNDLATLLPVKTLTVEILENVEPDPPVVSACLKLKELGYQIALDDVTSLERQKPLLDLANIVKVDFSLTDAQQQREIARRLRPAPRQAPGRESGDQRAIQAGGKLGLPLLSGLLLLQAATDLRPRYSRPSRSPAFNFFRRYTARSWTSGKSSACSGTTLRFPIVFCGI